MRISGEIGRVAGRAASVCMAVFGFWTAEGGAATSQPISEPAANTICGYAVSEAVNGVWRELGGETGRLGCATTRETTTSTSPGGSAARVAVFGQNGEIVLHVTGPRAGQAFSVWGCFYRLYVQFSATSGWLGLPVEDAVNTPDGFTQAFEGGAMRFTRAYDDCEATPAPAAAPTATPSQTETEAPLDVFENPTTGDRLSLAAARSVAEVTAAGYKRLANQARVMKDPSDGARPLKLLRNDSRNLWVTVASSQTEADALADGFVFEAGQGFVWSGPRPGAIPLKLFRDAATGRARLTAGETDEAEATAKGYRFVRIEGYAASPPRR